MKKILIAPDKFKGSLSAIEVCKAIAKGLQSRDNNDLDINFHPIADGGDGSVAILSSYLALAKNIVSAKDPLGREIFSSYYTSKDAAYIEVATNSGWALLSEKERNPLYTSSQGSGELIKDAILKGFKNIYVFLGGSGTNDAGMGIAHALGFRFLDFHNNTLTPIGNHLTRVHRIIDETEIDFKDISITFFFDVVNPLYGPNGAAHIYAPQKGATESGVKMLDNGLRNISKILKQHTGIDVSEFDGIGSAGGMAACLVALLGAQLTKGFDFMAQQTGLEAKILQSDLVICGEGKLDTQSLEGKVIEGMARLCNKHQKPLVLFAGKNELDVNTLLGIGVERVFTIMNIAENQQNAMENGEAYLVALAQQVKF